MGHVVPRLTSTNIRQLLTIKARSITGLPFSVCVVYYATIVSVYKTSFTKGEIQGS